LFDVDKWELPIPAQLAGQVRGNFPTWGRKTDAERVQNISDEVLESLMDEEFEVTVKRDGSSCSMWHRQGDVGVCSRNLDLKLEDEESQEVAYTKVACKLLDCQTASCRDYPNRKQHVPDCIQLTPELLDTIHWLPPSCAYRRLHEGKNLPRWHYLNTGSRQSILKAKKSAAGRCISEEEIQDDDIEDYIVRWVR
jgi:uncharacterized cysteine cluster protein YcgN (CxxCxxCC family)